ncbi:hypothetical protein [Gimesia sp.]|uniref:hypothetical protein n=1 Tax=Gimesia sp. TaxID=2024833 RepID=UPI0025BA386F|nr:hypothetical protein [Gimesia sp.]
MRKHSFEVTFRPGVSKGEQFCFRLDGSEEAIGVGIPARPESTSGRVHNRAAHQR